MADVYSLAEQQQQQSCSMNVADTINSTPKEKVTSSEYFEELEAFLSNYEGIEEEFKVLNLVKNAIQSLKKSRKRVDIANIFKHLGKEISLLEVDKALNKLCDMQVLNKIPKAGYTSYTFASKNTPKISNTPQPLINSTSEVCVELSHPTEENNYIYLRSEISELRKENELLKGKLEGVENILKNIDLKFDTLINSQQKNVINNISKPKCQSNLQTTITVSSTKEKLKKQLSDRRVLQRNSFVQHQKEQLKQNRAISLDIDCDYVKEKNKVINNTQTFKSDKQINNDTPSFVEHTPTDTILPEQTPITLQLPPDIQEVTPDTPIPSPHSTAKTHAYNPTEDMTNVQRWPEDTVLVCGDSIIAGIEEKRLHRLGKVKVRCFKGATVENLHSHLVPLLQKQPKTIIIHIGTNNCINETSEAIMFRIDELVKFVKRKLPQCTVIMSTPTIRLDLAKATLTTKRLSEKIKISQHQTIVNDNITKEHLGLKGLHLNSRGTVQLAKNFLDTLKNL